MRCLTSLNIKAFAGSCKHLPVVTQPFGVLCLAWACFELMDFTSCFSHLPSILFLPENWDTGCPRMCWDWHLFTTVCEVKPKLPCEWESAPKASRRFPNSPSSYRWAPTSLSMSCFFQPLLEHKHRAGHRWKQHKPCQNTTSCYLHVSSSRKGVRKSSPLVTWARHV